MTTELSWIEQVHGDMWLCDRWEEADKSFDGYLHLKCGLHGATMYSEWLTDGYIEAQLLWDVLEEKCVSRSLAWQTEEVTA